MDLAKLPWETWDIGTDLGNTRKIRIARTPANIRNESVIPLRRKARVLAIFGDDTHLDFTEEEKALKSLRSIVHVELLNCKQILHEGSIDPSVLKTKLVQAISHPLGWDMLFFAGHSGETILTGGEFRIAPGISLSMHEIEDVLKVAKKRGLQFAIFNSCSGINIAESLVNVGLNQVIIMREGIDNQVAQEYLAKFLLSLADHKDVHTANLDANEFLKQQEQRLSYPSSYLVSSLFRHPDAELFKIERFGWWEYIKQWAPNKKQLICLMSLIIIILITQVQNLFLNLHGLFQAYPYAIQTVTKLKTPVLLVKDDENSLITNEFLSTDLNQGIVFFSQNKLFLIPLDTFVEVQGKYSLEKHTILTAPSIKLLQSTRQPQEVALQAELR